VGARQRGAMDGGAPKASVHDSRNFRDRGEIQVDGSPVAQYVNTIAGAAMALVILAGCAASGPMPRAANPAPVLDARSLYDRLGGKTSIAAVVDELLARIRKDDRIDARFAHADMNRLRNGLVDQLCEATGGPCKYAGKDMKTAHLGMKIAGPEFDALLQDLKDALDHFGVPAREEGELIGALAPMKKDIVEPAAVGSAGGASGSAGLDPVVLRAGAFRDSAALLEKADAARLTGNRSFAEQLFSSAELLTGAEAIADLAPLFREGAPPRVMTPLRRMPLDSAAQPVAVGSSDEENPEPEPRRGSLSGAVVLPGRAPLPGLAVVTLEPASGRFRRRPPRQRTIEQRNREFAPRVLVVPVGSTVTFPNFDDIFHNVFSRSAIRPFDLGIYKSGQSRELTFDKEGVIHIGCNLHANMSAYVVVVSAPHYVVTDSQGRFLFRSLEPGRYRLRAWTEGSDTPRLQDIEIKPERNRIEVTAVAAATRPLADKFGAPRDGAPRL
jgi:hemoglobin